MGGESILDNKRILTHYSEEVAYHFTLSRTPPFQNVTPAKAGVQKYMKRLDSGSGAGFQNAKMLSSFQFPVSSFNP